MFKYKQLPQGWATEAACTLQVQVLSFERLHDGSGGTDIAGLVRHLYSSDQDCVSTFVVYNIQVTTTMPSKGGGPNSSTWIVQKRFSELRTLYNMMQKVWCAEDGTFPRPTHPFLLDDEKLFERQIQLQRVLSTLAWKRNRLELGVRLGLILDSFLDVDDSKCTQELQEELLCNVHFFPPKMFDMPSNIFGGVTVSRQKPAVRSGAGAGTEKPKQQGFSNYLAANISEAEELM